MRTKNILIIGGYGNTGSKIAELLLRHTSARITIAGRNLSKAKQKAKTLSAFYLKDVEGIQLDVAELEALKKQFAVHDLAVIASSTIPFIHNVIEAALETNTDVLDTQLSSPYKIEKLKENESAFYERNITVITDAGFHPGVPAAMIKHAQYYFDEMWKANVYSYMGINWADIEVSDNTIDEFTDEIKHFNPTIYKEGDWHKVPLNELGQIEATFNDGQLKAKCTPMYLHELEQLPKVIPSLKETGFFVSGFNWVSDNLGMPLLFLGNALKLNVVSKWAARTFYKSLQRFSKPPYVTILKLEAEGMKDNQLTKVTISLKHEDAYWLTAIPVVTTIIEYMEEFHPAGLYYQAHYVKPAPFLAKMADMGVKMRVSKG